LVFVIRLIDIGNYVQLAQSVQAIASEFVASGVNGKLKPLESPRYTAETLRDLYSKIILGAPPESRGPLARNVRAAFYSVHIAG
jgi:hypothetical protein